ncbi:hypothetical protein D3C74_438630 [compost metagenome]
MCFTHERHILPCANSSHHSTMVFIYRAILICTKTDWSVIQFAEVRISSIIAHIRARKRQWINACNLQNGGIDFTDFI